MERKIPCYTQSCVSIKLFNRKIDVSIIEFTYSPYEPDNIYTSVAVGDDIGPVHNATVFYHYKASLINILTWRLYTPRVYIEYVIIESMEYNTRYCK